MTGVDANGEHGGENRDPGGPQTRRRGVGLVAQLRGPTALTHCDGIPWTFQGQSAAAQAQIELWIVVGALARERRGGRDAVDDGPGT